ncbi:MAG: universal stress protein [Eggerthellaceae bacterium]|nr:universal stress protein [Eggerthellaceae bacterium]
MFQKIVVPFDWSEPSYRALDHAIFLAEMDKNSKIFILNVVPAYAADPKKSLGFHSTDAFFKTPEYLGVVDTLLTEAEQAIRDALSEKLAKVANDIEIQCSASDSPAHAIVEFAEHVQADIIVIGRRGLGALAGMLGSVSYGVLRATEISVLTVR